MGYFGVLVNLNVQVDSIGNQQRSDEGHVTRDVGYFWYIEDDPQIAEDVFSDDSVGDGDVEIHLRCLGRLEINNCVGFDYEVAELRRRRHFSGQILKWNHLIHLTASLWSLVIKSRLESRLLSLFFKPVGKGPNYSTAKSTNESTWKWSRVLFSNFFSLLRMKSTKQSTLKLTSESIFQASREGSNYSTDKSTNESTRKWSRVLFSNFVSLLRMKSTFKSTEKLLI